MQKLLGLFVGTCLFLGLKLPAYAQFVIDTCPPAPISIDDPNCGFQKFKAVLILVGLIPKLIFLGSIIAILFLLVGVFRLMKYRKDRKKKKAAIKIIIVACAEFALVMLVYYNIPVLAQAIYNIFGVPDFLRPF